METCKQQQQHVCLLAAGSLQQRRLPDRVQQLRRPLVRESLHAHPSGCVWKNEGSVVVCCVFCLSAAERNVLMKFCSYCFSRIWDTASGQCLKTLIGKSLLLLLTLFFSHVGVFILHLCLCLHQMTTTLPCRL